MGADTSAVGRRTDEIICRSLLAKRCDIWKRSAPRGEYESLVVETTHPAVRKKFGTSQWCKWILSRKIGGREDITREGKVLPRDLSLSTSLPTCSPTTFHGTTEFCFTVDLPLLFWSPVTRTRMLLMLARICSHSCDIPRTAWLKFRNE